MTGVTTRAAPGGQGWGAADKPQVIGMGRHCSGGIVLPRLSVLSHLGNIKAIKVLFALLRNLKIIFPGIT